MTSQEDKQDVYMTFYDKSIPLYRKTDASGVDLGAGLLQVREGLKCGCDEVADNAILCSTAFASKSLSSAEWQYSNIKW